MKKIIFLILPAILFALSHLPGMQREAGAVLLDRIVATVNEEVITWSELMDVIIMDGMQILGTSTGEERLEKIREIQRPFLNNLIEMKLQLQEAQRMQLNVSDAEIDGAINEIMSKYGLSQEALEDSLKAEGLSEEDYRLRLSDQILLQKVVNYTVRNNIMISDKEIEEYYEDNKSTLNVEEQLRISQIFFALPDDSARKDAIEAVALQLVLRINSGEDFAKLAAEFSEDPSREFGGDLGYISRGSALKEIEDIAVALKKGEVSMPFWSPAGLHIIKLVDRKGGGGIDKVRDRIREALMQKSFARTYREWKAGLREKAYIEIKL